MSINSVTLSWCYSKMLKRILCFYKAGWVILNRTRTTITSFTSLPQHERSYQGCCKILFRSLAFPPASAIELRYILTANRLFVCMCVCEYECGKLQLNELARVCSPGRCKMKRPHNFLVNATATQASVSCAWSVKTNRRTVKVVRIGYSIVCQWVSMWLLCVRVCCCCCAAVYCDCCYLFLFRCTFLRSTLWKYTKTATNPHTHTHTHTLAESARLKESQAAGDYWESPRKKIK